MADFEVLTIVYVEIFFVLVVDFFSKFRFFSCLNYLFVVYIFRFLFEKYFFIFIYWFLDKVHISVLILFVTELF